VVQVCACLTLVFSVSYGYSVAARFLRQVIRMIGII